VTYRQKLAAHNTS